MLRQQILSVDLFPTALSIQCFYIIWHLQLTTLHTWSSECAAASNLINQSVSLKWFQMKSRRISDSNSTVILSQEVLLVIPYTDDLINDN